MSTIASLSIMVGVNTSDLEKGMKTATQKIDSFKKHTESQLDDLEYLRMTPLESAAYHAEQAVGKDVKKLKSHISDFAGSAREKLNSIDFVGIAAGVAALGLAAAGAVAELAKAGLDRIDKLSDSAQSLGVATDKLSELQYAANLTGSSAEDLDTALEKLNANLGDSINKATPASDALARLGLDAKQLSGLSLDQAFKSIVGGFEKIPNASERASLAMDIFGKGGLKLINTLGAGSASLDELAKEAQRLGVSVNQIDAAKIGAAKDAIDRSAAAIEGLSNQVAIALTPAIVAASSAFGDMAGEANKLGSAQQGVEQLVVGVASMAEFLEGGVVIWKQLGNAVTYSVGVSLEALGKLDSVLLSLIPAASLLRRTLGGEWADLGKAMRQEAEKTGKEIEKSLVGKSVAERIREGFAAAKVELSASAKAQADLAKGGAGATSVFDTMGSSIADVTKKLQEQLATFGQTTAKVELYKLAQMGATEEQLKGVRALQEQLDMKAAEKKSLEDLMSYAKGVKDSVATPIEKAREELEKLAHAHAAGLLDDMTFDRASKKALGGDSQQSGPKFAGALELGSSEARTALLNATTGRGSDKGLEAAMGTRDGVNKTVGLLNTISQLLKPQAEISLTRS